MSTYDENLADYKTLIGKLVSGEKKVVNLEADQREAIFEIALKQTLISAENTVGRILGDDRIWITRGLSIIITLADIEDHPDIKQYIDKEGYFDTAGFDSFLMEQLDIIRTALRFFIEEKDCPGKTAAIMALAATNHPLDFYEEEPFGENILQYGQYVRISFKHGYIRVKKDNH